MAKRPIQKEKKQVETTGHEWDGIEEYNNPMPRWWVMVFYATIIWGIGYMILYPSWPVSSKGALPGVLHWSTRADVAREIERFRDMNAELDSKLANADLTAIDKDPDLKNYALHYGKATFATFCSQCHGSGAQGGPGFPNLLDDDWLWGGDIETIHTTIEHGIRSPDDEDTRTGEMPAWGGEDGMLSKDEIKQVVAYVLSVSGGQSDPNLAEAGKTVFEDNCTACHGDDARGNREVGAPNLTDAIWLYGGDPGTIEATVTYGRAGVMPAWHARLSPSQIAAVATYVHELGGGE